MNALLNARRAYSAVSAPTRTARDIEYEALARVTQKLQSLKDAKGVEFPSLVAAIHENRKIWNIFALDVANPNNTLPNELRERIFYLAEFTRLQSSLILAGKSTVDPILEINKAIMRGLRGEVG